MDHTFLDEIARINPVLTWTGSDLEWQLQADDKRFRNVRCADTDPEFRQFPDWTPALVGSSGWNPYDRVSVWGGADFDDLSHSAGLADDRIETLISAFKAIPWLQIQRSKGGGGGFHIYWRWNPESLRTAVNRAQHKHNCLRVLHYLEKLTGQKLIDGDVDCAGLILWLWSAERNENSFAVLQTADGFVPDDLPDPPAQKRKPTIKVDAADFEDEHREIIDSWSQSGFSVVTDQINGQSVVRLHVRAALNGPDKSYRTESQGTRPNALHAYAWPITGGGFLIVQFGGKTDCAPWFKSASGNLCCLYNVSDIDQKARHRLTSIRGKYHGTVADIASVLPVNPAGVETQQATLERDGSQWIVSFLHRKASELPAGWVQAGYKAVFAVDGDEPESGNLTDLVFCGERQGESNEWYTFLGGNLIKRSKDDCRSALSADHDKKDVDAAINDDAANPTPVVKVPFQPPLHEGRLNPKLRSLHSRLRRENSPPGSRSWSTLPPV